MHPFSRVSPADWRITETMAPRRREALLTGPSFTEIIEEVVGAAELLYHARERCRSDKNYFRFVAIIKCAGSHVDLFHNSASGYRAQYYAAESIGISANVYAVQHLCRQLFDLLGSHRKRTCPLPWINASVSAADAKVWIHQGPWLRANRHADRLLQVERWAEAHAPDECAKRRARWSRLTPGAEDRLDLKGGFVTLDGASLGTLKPYRAPNIYKHGYT